jgi:hypothetical protein
VDQHLVDSLREQIPQNQVLLAARAVGWSSCRPLLWNMQYVAHQQQAIVDAVALLKT